jgi:hypothetical protein
VGSPESGGSGSVLDGRSGGRGCGAHHGPVRGQKGEQGGSGEGARRRRPASAAGARAPVTGRCGLVDARAEGVKYVLRKVSRGSHGASDERNRGCGGGF